MGGLLVPLWYPMVPTPKRSGQPASSAGLHSASGNVYVEYPDSSGNVDAWLKSWDDVQMM